MKQWFFAVDRGGTFTDIIGIDPSNKIHTSKILSDSSAYSEGDYRTLLGKASVLKKMGKDTSHYSQALADLDLDLVI